MSPRLLSGMLTLGLVLPLAGCSGSLSEREGAAAGDPLPPTASTPRPEAVPSPGTSPQGLPRDPRTGMHPTGAAVPRGGMEQLGRDLAVWDALQGEGRKAEAGALAQRIQAQADLQFPTLVSASRGDHGTRQQYLAVSALGFTSRPEATRLLVERLSDEDERLASNALVALDLREDPTTPLAPIVRLIDPRVPIIVRRYAPLAFATVVQARMHQAQSLSGAEAEEAWQRLRTLAADRDGYTRLHVAKALGVVNTPVARQALAAMVRDDDQMRVRWAAAAALERTADPAGFDEVVTLLHHVPANSKHIIRDLLVSYAGKLQGTPLSSAEVSAMGTSALAWAQWRSRLRHARGEPAKPIDLTAR